MIGDLSAFVAAVSGAVAAAPEAAVAVTAGALALALLAWAVRARRRSKATASASRPVGSSRGAGRVWTVRTLARGGAHPAEVARRTGLAREAVHLVLRTTPPSSPSSPRVA